MIETLTADNQIGWYEARHRTSDIRHVLWFNGRGVLDSPDHASNTSCVSDWTDFIGPLVVQASATSAAILDLEAKLVAAEAALAVAVKNGEEWGAKLVAKIDEARAGAPAAEVAAGLRAIETLIEESDGVAGLHLNGNVAPWEELRTGGRFESWLLPFDDALAALRQPAAPDYKARAKAFVASVPLAADRLDDPTLVRKLRDFLRSQPAAPAEAGEFDPTPKQGGLR
jgi:hypothetical protein